jgi:hypothetical protein
MNLFRHWSWTGMFRVTWAISACTFGARFQVFCEKRLNLELGKIRVKEINPNKFSMIKKAIFDLAKSESASESGENMMNKHKKVLAKFFDDPLNPFELMIIKELVKKCNIDFDKIFSFELIVQNILDRNEEKIFNYGFALIKKSQDGINELIQFRVQDHLRGMGLGRNALREMVKNYNVGRLYDIKCKPGIIKQIDPADNRYAFNWLFQSVIAESDLEVK